MRLVSDLWKARGRWLAERRLLWITLGTLLAAIGAAALFGLSEQSIRLAGLALEIAGLATVASGIRDTRLFFGQPGMVSIFYAWIKRFPGRRRDAVALGASIQMGAIGMAAFGYGWHDAGASASIEERLAVAEKNLGVVRKNLDLATERFGTEIRALQGRVKEESKTREVAIRELGTKLEVSETGGLHVATMGLVWLFAGMLLSTASQEIACAWARLV